jgi:uncharacterized surface anchored protein
VTVQLKDSTGTVVQTTTTDANGNYTFNNVPAGNYTVVETNKPGFWMWVTWMAAIPT